MKGRRLEHMPALDGVRGAAVVAVLLFHGGHLAGGYLGVDLFFVLSGFLITSLLLAEGSTDHRVDLGNFWARRARRLLPALGVMLLGVAAYARFVADPADLHRIRMDGVATIFYVANWRAVFAHVDYWALFASPSPMEHTWSLAIEEQFYVVWPLIFVGVLAWARRSGRPVGPALAERVLAVAVALGAASAAAAVALYEADGTNRVYYGTDTRAFAIVAGVAVAALAARYGHVRGRAARTALEAAGLAGVAVLALAWVRLDGSSPRLYHGGLLACSAAGALLIAASAHPRRGPIAAVASFAPLRWLGLISYGLYLYHWPLFVWLNAERVHLTGWPLFAVRTAATLTVSIVSYRWLEQPIRHARGWPLRTRILVPSAGLAAVSIAILAATTGYRPPPRSTFTSAALDQAVDHAKASGGPRIMIVGNSVGWFLADEGLAEVRSHPQISTYNAARFACAYPDTDAIETKDGRESTTDLYSCDLHWDQVVDRFQPDVVLFIRNDVADDGFHHDGQFLRPCSAAYRQWLTQSLESDGRRLTRHGARLVLVSSAYPGSRFAAAFKAYYGPADVRAATCVNDTYRAVAAAHPDTMGFIDLNAHLCERDGPCVDEVDGTRLRPDDVHFRGEGARLIADWIVGQLNVVEVVPGPKGSA